MKITRLSDDTILVGRNLVLRAKDGQFNLADLHPALIRPVREFLAKELENA